MNKVLIWLASGERDKLTPGIVWGVNADKWAWVDEVRFVVFGESERTLAEDDELFAMIQEVNQPMYCKFAAKEKGLMETLEGKGARIEYVGEPIAEMIREGFQVLVF